jgi:hypothetical protein
LENVERRWGLFVLGEAVGERSREHPSCKSLRRKHRWKAAWDWIYHDLLDLISKAQATKEKNR